LLGTAKAARMRWYVLQVDPQHLATKMNLLPNNASQTYHLSRKQSFGKQLNIYKTPHNAKFQTSK
jgi:hypothetical protein